MCQSGTVLSPGDIIVKKIDTPFAFMELIA